MEELPDYYDVLGTKQTATSSEIREAYKLRALETHPDRYTIIDSSVTREEATKAFQKVADAYSVLSNPIQKEKYDDFCRKRNSARSSPGRSSRFTPSPSSETPLASALSVFYSTFTSPDPDVLFGNIFEELLRPEVDTPHWFYAPIGTIAGGILGFILGNLPGLILGAYLGGKLGSVRDAKGKKKKKKRKKRGLCVTGKELRIKWAKQEFEYGILRSEEENGPGSQSITNKQALARNRSMINLLTNLLRSFDDAILEICTHSLASP